MRLVSSLTALHQVLSQRKSLIGCMVVLTSATSMVHAGYYNVQRPDKTLVRKVIINEGGDPAKFPALIEDYKEIEKPQTFRFNLEGKDTTLETYKSNSVSLLQSGDKVLKANIDTENISNTPRSSVIFYNLTKACNPTFSLDNGTKLTPALSYLEAKKRFVNPQKLSIQAECGSDKLTFETTIEPQKQRSIFLAKTSKGLVVEQK